jgi:hypothetical protein
VQELSRLAAKSSEVRRRLSYLHVSRLSDRDQLAFYLAPVPALHTQLISAKGMELEFGMPRAAIHSPVCVVLVARPPETPCPGFKIKAAAYTPRFF